MLAADKFMVERYTKDLIQPFLVAQGSMVGLCNAFDSIFSNVCSEM